MKNFARQYLRVYEKFLAYLRRVREKYLADLL